VATAPGSPWGGAKVLRNFLGPISLTSRMLAQRIAPAMHLELSTQAGIGGLSITRQLPSTALIRCFAQGDPTADPWLCGL